MLLVLVYTVYSFHSKADNTGNTRYPASQMSPPTTRRIATQEDSPPVVNRGLPSRLIIPKITVDAKVLFTGQTKAGAMDTPTNIVDVGWYKYGPLPGNQGSAVIAGHIDGLKGEPGVFSDLNKLQAGDSMSVIDSAGRPAAFVVTTVKTYGQDEQPSEVFTSSSGSHLNLITCSGAWDAGQHHFQKRLVVFADKVN